MAKEIENIQQTASVGELPRILEATDASKTEVEGKLMELVNMLVQIYNCFDFCLCFSVYFLYHLQNALLQETSEEWEQCEKKMKDVRHWIDKTKQALESPQNKKKPLRDQLALREKILGDISIQKTKISMSVDKLNVRTLSFYSIFFVFRIFIDWCTSTTTNWIIGGT